MQKKMITPTAPFTTGFFPLHIALLTVGENMMPIGYWTVISKDPFRFLICMGVGNHSLGLLRKYKEAALHFLPWNERERIVSAGHHSGRNVNKAELLGFDLFQADELVHTKIIKGAVTIFEMKVHMELVNLSREFAPHVMDVVATHGNFDIDDVQPILYLSLDDFATIGERWQYKK